MKKKITELIIELVEEVSSLEVKLEEREEKGIDYRDLNMIEMFEKYNKAIMYDPLIKEKKELIEKLLKILNN